MKNTLESASTNLVLTAAAISAITTSVANDAQAAVEVPASPTPKVETFTSPAIDYINQQTDPQVIAAYCKANAAKLNRAEMNAGILKFQQLTLSIMEKMFAGKSQDEIKGLLAQKGNEWMKDEPYAAKGRSIYAAAAKTPAVTPPTPKPEANANGIGGEGADAQNNNQDIQEPEAKQEPAKRPLVGSSKKLPPLNETPAQKDARKERERQEDLLKETLATLNKGGFFKKEGWSSNDGKGAKASSKHSRDSITVEFDAKTVKKGVTVTAAKSTSSFKVTLLPGKAYRWTFGKVSDKANIMLKDNANGKFNTLAGGMTTGANHFRIPDGHDGTVELEIVNTAMTPTTTIEKATLEEITDEEARIAGL